ncbi:hypothetical protein [Maribacter forsetii]|uniref:hypothetical protein n=1 Tax=Maribacter forsetii TaxID=444515 RepID=UPI000562E73C|nr:hypothetical protein [Maribacter forsetii]
MTNEELDKIIKKIEHEYSKSEAYFDSEFNEDFGFAKGNKSGLLLYAKEFLKAVREIDKRKFDEGEMEVYNPDFDWIDGIDSNPFQYIKITKKNSGKIKPKKQRENESWKSKMLGIGCVVSLVFVVIFSIIGMITFFKWLS